MKPNNYQLVQYTYHTFTIPLRKRASLRRRKVKATVSAIRQLLTQPVI